MSMFNLLSDFQLVYGFYFMSSFYFILIVLLGFFSF